MNVSLARKIISDRHDELMAEIKRKKGDREVTDAEITEIMASDPFLAGKFYMLSVIMLDWVTKDPDSKSSRGLHAL